MQHKYIKQIIGFALVLDIILIDQITKWAVLEHVFRPLAEPNTQHFSFFAWLMHAPEKFLTVRTEVLPFFNFTMVWNHGVSFGLFQSGNPWPLILLACGISTLFTVWLVRSQNWFQIISLAMIIGGAMGNVIDRIRFGAVADFLDFHINGWHYPAFNIADSAITLGIIFLLFDNLILEPRRNRINITT